MSATRRYSSPFGSASPRCWERKRRTPVPGDPRRSETNAGRSGSNRCVHSSSKPSRLYHCTAALASLTRRIGTVSSGQACLSSLEPPRSTVVCSTAQGCRRTTARPSRGEHEQAVVGVRGGHVGGAVHLVHRVAER